MHKVYFSFEYSDFSLSCSMWLFMSFTFCPHNCQSVMCCCFLSVLLYMFVFRPFVYSLCILSGQLGRLTKKLFCDDGSLEEQRKLRREIQKRQGKREKGKNEKRDASLLQDLLLTNTQTCKYSNMHKHTGINLMCSVYW